MVNKNNQVIELYKMCSIEAKNMQMLFELVR